MSKTPPEVRSRDAAAQRTRPSGSTAERGQRRPSVHRRRRPWWKGPLPIVATFVVVIAAIIAFVLIATQGRSADAQIGRLVPANILNGVTSVSASTVASVGAGKLPDGTPMPPPYYKVNSTPLTANGKPQFLYIGGDFCPWCAADRWSIVNALSRFGTFSNLHYMRSAATDGDIATFTFYGASYSSKYISFDGIENADRDGKQLAPLSTVQQQLLSTLGHNGYPFVDIAGKYANNAPNSYPAGFPYSVLSGKSWQQIVDALSNPADPVTLGVIGNANYLTATICKVTGNQPAAACNVPAIRNISL